MYKKLKFFKMFLGTILMTLTLISVLKSCSYAYTIDDFIDYSAQIKDIIGIDNKLKTCATVVYNYRDTIKSLMESNNITATSFYAINSRYSSDMYNVSVNFSNNENLSVSIPGYDQQASFTSNQWLNKYIKISYSYGSWSTQVVNNSRDIGSSNAKAVSSFGLLMTSYNVPYSNWYLQNNFIPPYNGPVFTPVDNGLINVTNSLGTTIQMNRLPFSRSLTSWKIGKITDINDSILTIKGHFGPLVSSDNDGDITNTKYQFLWRKGDNVTSNGFTIASDGNVYINTQYLIPNQSYNAWFWYSTDNVNTTDFGDTWFYAYYNTSNPASGDAISSSLNDDTDIGFINAFGDLVSPQPEDIESTANSIFQNPYGSGEFFGITYDEDFDGWGFGTFIYNLIQGIITTFTSFNNVTMDFGVLGAINSSAFSIGNSYVGAFLSFFCNAILVITLIFWYYRLVKSFATLDLTTISKYDFDKMFNIF